ncbi:hypothetical protein [Streptomyces sp. NBC_01198]|uniref:hypothetical protein n=1 Tax=Streptomyces sp. NBC_01198 TaxID=2903769 RepID=UPI002E10FF34|nr:hypothetical protein OG702_06055 [Streptomyces sp. NBC_01198]
MNSSESTSGWHAASSAVTFARGVVFWEDTRDPAGRSDSEMSIPVNCARVGTLEAPTLADP